MKKIIVLMLFNLSFVFGQNCNEMNGVPYSIASSNPLIVNNLNISLDKKASGYSNLISCNGKYYNNIYPNNNIVKFSFNGQFDCYGDHKSRYKIRLYKIKFLDQVNRSYINSRASLKVYESNLIYPNTAEPICNKIKFEVETNVDNNYTYYAEVSFQHKGAFGIWGLPKKFNSNTINILNNCYPKLSYFFNNEIVETAKLINANINDSFNIQFDFVNTINCGNTYYISVEDSDAWMGRNPSSQVGKWVKYDDLKLINNKDFDLKKFYQTFNKSFNLNKYYRVEVAIGSPYLTKIFLLKLN